MEQTVLEYLANAAWQLPVLALGAWLLVGAVRPGPRVQHWMWLAALVLALVLPGVRTTHPAIATAANSSAIVLKDPDSLKISITASLPATRPVERTQSVSRDTPVLAPVAMKIKISPPDEIKRTVKPASPTHRLHLTLSSAVANSILGCFVLSLVFGSIRIGRAWQVARRLVRNSDALELTPMQRVAWLECAQRFGVDLPQIRESHAIASPVIVGAFAPVLLLPAGFARHTEDEARAVLCHELAHIARRDYLANLLCLLAALPLVWHPVSHEVQRRIGRTREMACDQMAAAAMESEVVYARCLLALARQMLAGNGVAERVGVVGLLGHNVLEERLMRLMAKKTTMSLRAKVARGMSGALVMTAVILAAAIVRVTPTLAESVAQPAEHSLPVQAPAVPAAASPATPAVQAEPAMPAAPQNPASPSAAPVSVVPPAAPAAATPTASPEDSIPETSVGEGQSTAFGSASSPSRSKSSSKSSYSYSYSGPGEIDDSSTNKAGSGHSVSVEKNGDGKVYITRDGVRQEMTPADSAEMQKKIQAQADSATARMRSPEFRKQMAEIGRQLAASQVELSHLNADKYRLEAEKQARMFHSPAYTLQMKQLDSPEFKKQLEDTQKVAEDFDMQIRIPEFKLQMEKGQLEALKGSQSLDTAAMEREIRAASRQMNSASQQLEVASKRLEEATRALKEAQSKGAKDK